MLVEVDHLTRSQRPADPPVLALLDAISAGEHSFAPIGLDLLEAASVLDRQHVDLQLGLTDCIVMTLARQLDEPVFTFDFRDFRAVTVGGRTLELVVSEARLVAERRARAVAGHARAPSGPARGNKLATSRVAAGGTGRRSSE